MSHGYHTRFPKSPPTAIRFGLRSLLFIFSMIAVATWLCVFSYRAWARQREVKIAAQKLAIPTTITDSDLTSLSGYLADGQFDSLDLSGSQITDDGLKKLAAHKQLRRFDLRQTLVSWRRAVEFTLEKPGTWIWMDDLQVTGSVRDGKVIVYYAAPNASFAKVAESEHLRGFATGGCMPWFNDTHLAAFNGLGAIEWLELQGTSVTEKSAELILAMKQLRRLVLPDSMSKEAVDRLRQRMPQCMVRNSSIAVHEKSYLSFVQPFRSRGISTSRVDYRYLSIYSRKDQEAAMAVRDDDRFRLLIKGKVVHDCHGVSGADAVRHYVPLPLRAGWNTLVAEVYNATPSASLHLRISDDPEDLGRIEAAEFLGR
jgi:hypothetical protein